jgi:hypothetical protein
MVSMTVPPLGAANPVEQTRRRNASRFTLPVVPSGLVAAPRFGYDPPPMEREAPPPADGSPRADLGNSRLWIVPLLALVAWQGWLTLSLFGPDPWHSLLDGEPIVSGRHPLHLYHGYLGARSFFDRGSLCCYDPSFQAGYPKTPVFDGGSRPAELFLILAGGAYRPAAYKVGLAVCCLLAPLLLWAAARGAGLSRAAACLATGFGLLVWWGRPAREALDAGDVDLLLAALAALAQFGLLLRFDRAPGFVPWLGILAAGYLGWFAHPLFFAVLLPLALVYYLSVGVRHGLVWHLALLAGLAGAVGLNAFWLRDWVAYWWIRSPLETGGTLLSHRTFHTIWAAPLWGGPTGRALAVLLLAAGFVGVTLLNLARRRAAARLFGLGALAFLALALAGIASEPLGRLGTSRLLTPALLFAAVPAAHALAAFVSLTCRVTGGPLRGAAAVAGLLAGIGLIMRDDATALERQYAAAPPLALGIGPERRALVEELKAHTTADARILWEDRAGVRDAALWTALLPLLTQDEAGGRCFLGGLDPAGTIEHTQGGFGDQALGGRHIGQWKDEELRDFCKRYNVGWVVCWSPAAVTRFAAWGDAEQVATLSDDVPGALFALRRPHSFALKGKANWLDADCEHVTLGDVVPEDGKVVLSLHYQAGMRALPGRVQVEREIDPYDPIPLVRLKVPAPVTRVTLTWEN